MKITNKKGIIILLSLCFCSIMFNSVSALPDLAAEISYAPENASVGDMINVTMVVRNIGADDADNVTVLKYSEDDCISPVPMPPSNISKNLSINFTFNKTLRYGELELKLAADPGNEINETDESNNNASIIFNFPIMILTDKNTYLANESINIRITGNNGTGVVSTNFGCKHIYRFENNTWEEIEVHCLPCSLPHPVCYNNELKELSVNPYLGCYNQQINSTWIWDQKEWFYPNRTCGNSTYTAMEKRLAHPGRYKAMFCYDSYACEFNCCTQCIETSEFTIESCVALNDDLYINEDTVLCPGVYNINDFSAEGIIIINASNVALDCNGSTMNGNGAGYGIYNPGFDNVTIKNCNIMNYEKGIYLWNASNNSLTNNIVNSNSYGIISFVSSNNKVLNNTANSNGWGILLDDSSDNILQENEVSNNNVGICSQNSNSTINSNIACGNTNLDFNSSDWQLSSGNNNTCDNADGWNDTGNAGCSFGCSICNDTYNLVCGIDGKTYNNSCLAKEAGVEILYKGRCTSWWWPYLYLYYANASVPPGKNPTVRIYANLYNINFSVYSLSMNDLKYSDYELLSMIETRTPIKTWNEEVEGYDKEIIVRVNDTGAYFVAASYKRYGFYKAGVRVFVSKLGLISKSSGNKTLIYAFDVLSGEPLENTVLKFYDNDNKNLLSGGATDENGSYETELNTYYFNVIGNYSGHLMDLNVYDYYYDYYSKNKLKANIYTDRPIYRPNQRVFFKGIVWMKNDSGYEILDGEEVQIKIKSPSNQGENTIYTGTLYTNEFGSLSGDVMLGDEIPLGTYTIEFTVRNLKYYGYFDVEEYRKPEYKVTLKPDEDAYVRGDNVSITLSAEYFFGKPVAEGNVRYKVYRKPYYKYPSCYPWICTVYSVEYYPYPSYSEELITQGELTTDANGIAKIKFETDKNYSYDARYRIEAEVTDKSRHTVSEEIGVLVSKAEFSIGIITDKYGYNVNETVNAKLTAEDISGKTVTADAEVSVVKYRWAYINNTWIRNDTVILKQNITINHTANVQFTPEEYGEYIIKVNSEDSQGNEVYASRYVWVYSYNYYNYYNSKSDSLELILDKEVYEKNDTPKLLINSQVSDFYAYITIEGENIYAHSLEYFNGASGVVDIPIKDSYVPNVFINVIIIKNNKYYSSTRELIVMERDKLLNITIISDKNIYEPGEEAKFLVEVRDTNGTLTDAELSLSIVDEAIYAIKEDESKIEDFFYNQRRYNWVITGYWLKKGYGARKSGEIPPIIAPLPSPSLPAPVVYESITMDYALSEAGGEFAPAQLRKYFPDTAFWNAHILAANGTASIELKMPDSLTTWRATAKGINLNKQAGTVRDMVIVRKNLFIRAETPRFFTQKDKLLISGVVHNYLGYQKDVLVTINVSNNINVSGSKERWISVAHNADERVDWKVYVEGTGTGDITLCAYTDEESDCMNAVVPIMPHGIKNTKTTAGIVNDNETIYMDADAAGKGIMYITSSIVGNALDALDYLISYPYGCMEQTMSAFLPDIIVVRAINELDIELENDELERKLPDMVDQGLQRIYDYQHDDGGWGWWKNDKTHPYMTAYIVYGLTQAKLAGFDVDGGVLSNGVNSIRNQISGVDDQNMKAYMLYSLSFHDDISNYAVNLSNLSDYGKALYALALLNSGGDASGLINELNDSAICTAQECHWSAQSYKYGWRNNDVETTSYVIMATLKVDQDNEKIVKGIKWLINKKQGNRWYSTKDTALAIMAIMEYAKLYGDINPDYDARIYLNGELIKDYSIEGIFSDKFSIDLENGANVIEIIKNGTGRLYYAVAYEYYTNEENISAEDNGIGVVRTYSNYQVKSGDMVNVTLQINASDMEYIIIEDPLPAGAEVVEEPSDYGIYYSTIGYYGYKSWSYCYARKEVRDEKMIYFITWLYKNTCTLRYTIRAETPGDYHVMPARAYNMYTPEINGISDEIRFRIRDNPVVKIPVVIMDNGTDKLILGINAFSIDEIIQGNFKYLEIRLVDAEGNVIAGVNESAVDIGENLTNLYIQILQGFSSLANGSYTIEYSVYYGNETISGVKSLQVGKINISDIENWTPEDYERWDKKGVVRYLYAGKPSAALNITLYKGWNLVSLPVEPEKLKINEAFKNLSIPYYVVYKSDNGSWEWYYSEWDEGNFSKFKMGKAYYVYVNDDVNVEIGGTVENIKIDIVRGWNMIGLPIVYKKDIKTIVKQIEGKYKYILYRDKNGIWKYYHYQWGENGLSDFSPGMGYFIYATGNATIVI